MKSCILPYFLDDPMKGDCLEESAQGSHWRQKAGIAIVNSAKKTDVLSCAFALAI